MPTRPLSVKISTISQPWKVNVPIVALDSIGETTSIGLVQKCGGSGTVLPFHCTTRVRISLIFIRFWVRDYFWKFESASTQDFAFGHVARHVEQLNLVDGLEVRLI